MHEEADDGPTRGELFSADRLVEHARQLAAAHGEPSVTIPVRPLLATFEATKQAIEQAYQGLEDDKRDPTPGEEWLFDNSHVVDDQLREIREDLPRGYLAELPRLTDGTQVGLPRVYALTLDFISHTDARIDLDTLIKYVAAYQEGRELTIGELWAVPIMLRLGLLQSVRKLAEEEVFTAEQRSKADAWAERMVRRGEKRGSEVVVTLAELATSEEPLSSPFLVQLIRRLREHDALVSSASHWVHERCAEMGTSPEVLARAEHLRQAENQVSIGNAITSMRAIAALDWNEFFERTSLVEQILEVDPAGAYVETDAASRDRYRHAVEDLAKRGRKDEVAVARLVVDHAKQAAAKAGGDPRATHVGFWLVDEGRALLEAEVGYRPKLLDRVRGLLHRRGATFYLGSIAAGSVLSAIFFTARTLARGAPLSWLVLFLLALPVVSELVVTAVNWLVTALLPPRLLPKLCLDDGVPAELRTLVVVPAFLSSEEGLRELCEELEVRSLSNPDEHVHFALLTDWPDADGAQRPGEAELLERARLAILELNRRFGRPDNDRYFLFHRRRVHDPAQGRWMGWERKRGKLEELNRLLRGEAERTTFELVTATPELLASVRYVITLDADTQLPRDIARRLVATIAHPLNRAQLDESGRRVVRGYGVVQPRVGTTLASACGSRFSRLSSGHAGIDPYTTAVSDVYQDLTGEGAYIGKAIYDVDAFRAALSGRVPDDRLLSHDLFEGIYARTALATDIELLDDQPSRYAAHAMRQHRWVRGDWQLASWLLPRVPTATGKARNDVGAMGWWKLFDNLRRSMLPPLSVALLLFGWLAVPEAAAECTALVALVLATPLYGRLASSLVRPAPAWASGALFGDLRNNAMQVLFNATVLLDQAALLVDAIARTFRRLIGGKDLLEWVTASDADRTMAEAKHPLRRVFSCSVAAVVIAALVVLRAPGSLPWALPLLLAWALAPVVVAFVSAPLPPRTRVVGEEDRVLLRRSARATWRFFETFVTDEDHWLPPDNYQEDPKGVIAHRTSPTNIGLYLLSTVAARDFGFVTVGELCRRLEDTLDTIDKLERYEGHVLNWYDTSTMAPLEPRYVSTVDNGNFVADLWALRQAAQEIVAAPVIGLAVLEAALDAVALHREARALPDVGAPIGDDAARVDELMTALVAAREQPPADVGGWSALLADLVARAESLAAPWRSETKEPREPADALAAWWAEAAATGLARAAQELTAVAGATGPVPALAACDTEEARALCARLGALGDRALRVADGMPFALVYDRGRELFSIGYNASNGRLDASYYDLLASEARLASLLAIAKGEVPQRHWFRLGRALAPAAGGRALLSWSGSMFEYLMPVLLTRRYEQTLLDETCDGVVARQRDYAKERGVPWGISESAFNTLDLGLTYQYRAFGVPGLGLKPGLADELVVAPYATMLAAQVDVGAATRNLRALIKEGALGGYGFYESIDYTPAHVPPGRHGVVVKAYMAHHQGMSLVALDNVLHDDPMQRRFHADPRIKASELLLQERIPLGVPINPPRDVGAAASAGPSHDDADAVDHVGVPWVAAPRVHFLASGELSTMVTSAGTGSLSWKRIDVVRWREDAALDGGGLLCYLRDLDSGEVWSAGHQPTRKRADAYEVSFSADHVSIFRRDGDIETVTAVVVSPEHPAEVRRVAVHNHSTTARRIEITTYAEPVLAARGADAAHPAFGNLFVETEALVEEGAVLARRRPRTARDATPWVAQTSAVMRGDFGVVEMETSRARFVGRGRDLTAPRALVEPGPLSGKAGTVLDPALVLRRAVTIPAGGRVEIAFSTVLAESREVVLELCAAFRDPRTIARTFELAWSDARVELKHLGISAAQSQRFQRLASALVFPVPGLRPSPDLLARNTRGRESLWRYGISGDVPILLVRLDDGEPAELMRELLLAHEFWRLNHFTADLVILNEEPGGYLQPVQDQVSGILRQATTQAKLDQPGGVYLRRSDQMPEEDRILFQSTARAVLLASQGSLARQLRRAAPADEPAAGRLAARLHAAAMTTDDVARAGDDADKAPAGLQLWNGRGGFSADGREYVIVVRPGAPTPAPWLNVIANDRFGFTVSERGSGFTWVENSQTHRLTPWSNDAVTDPAFESVYLRDDDTGALWSATPAPAGGQLSFVVRHGQGYSVFEHEHDGLRVELTVFTAARAAAKVSRLRVRNAGGRARRLSVVGCVEWVLGTTQARSAASVITQRDETTGALLARNPFSVFPNRVAFYTGTVPAVSHTCDRLELLGRQGSRALPAGLRQMRLSGRTGAGLDPCAALHVELALAADEEREVSFVLGEGQDAEEARALVREHAEPSRVQEHLDAAVRAWDDLLGAVTVKTPDVALDLLQNRWLLYQAVGCRIWARSAFYQSGGAYGFRDQLQDSLATVHAAPALCREHILRSAARQFVEGDVQHWWHPETGQGVRTRYADDLLWLPYVVALYIGATGDRSVLDETVPFIESRQLEPEEHEVFGVPNVSIAKESIYEHCVRALDKGATVGPHGLPLMGGGDWNDGMNRVGEGGRGESVWMAWFLAATCKAFAPLARVRGDAHRLSWCEVQIERLRRAVEEHAWDGAWYRRAYFDDGTPMGTKDAAECRIDAIAQSWAVISGIGDPERARRAMRSTEEHLVRDAEEMVLLFTPPFQNSEPNPGYVQSYPAGLRENGGQYTHGVLWSALATAMLGDGDRAHAMLRMLGPVSHGDTPQEVERYAVEPYVVAADVYAADGLMGRGGWTWYTGSASWLYRITLEALLGISRRGDKLRIAPVIPRAWPGFEVRYRHGASTWRIVVENTAGGARERAAPVIDVDGRRIDGDVPLRDDGKEHLVRVVLGAARVPAAQASPAAGS